MFGVGWTEMLVIGVVALVVIGPKDLPVVMRRLGKFVASIRRMGTDFQRELNKTTGLDQITDLRRSITEPLRQTSAEIAREFNAMATSASGTQTTGVVKPEDPKVESVYSAINSAAGIAPPEESGAKAEKSASPARKKTARKPRAAGAAVSKSTGAATASPRKAAAKPTAAGTSTAKTSTAKPRAKASSKSSAAKAPSARAAGPAAGEAPDLAKANGAALNGEATPQAAKPPARRRSRAKPAEIAGPVAAPTESSAVDSPSQEKA